MKIIQFLQTAVCQVYKREGLFAALKLAWKIHNILSVFQRIFSLLPVKSFQKRITYIPASIEVFSKPSEEKQIKNLKEIQVELLPFNDNEEEITPEGVREFIETFNQRYFNYFIDPEENLLAGIRTRKLQMIIKGEETYLQKVEDKFKGLGPAYQVYLILQAQQNDPLILKIRLYSENRLAMRGDIPYQKTMLEYFCEWYSMITQLPSLPRSAARYIT